jgi:hypothetical protein
MTFGLAKKTLMRRHLTRRTTSKRRRHEDPPHEAFLMRMKTKSALPAQSCVHGGIRQEKKHVVHVAPTRKRPTPSHLHKAAHQLLLSCQDQHGRCSMPGKDVSLPQPLSWTGASSLGRPKPSTLVNGTAVLLLGHVCGNPTPSWSQEGGPLRYKRRGSCLIEEISNPKLLLGRVGSSTFM